MVSDPPFSILRAAPKNCFGFCIAFASTPPLNTLPLDGATVLCALAKRVMESNKYHHIMSAFYQTFCFLQSHGTNFYMFFCRLIKGRCNYFCFYTAFHIGNLFRSFIHQHNHQVTFRMIFCNGICQFFQQHRFTRFWLGNNQSTLSFTNRCKQIHDPGAVIICSWYKDLIFQKETKVSGNQKEPCPLLLPGFYH